MMPPFLPAKKVHLYSQLLLVVLICVCSTHSAAEGLSEAKVLILQSHDTQLKAGELVSSATTVRLAPKEFLRVMMPSGEVAKIQGAYTGSIASALRDNGASNIDIGDLASAVIGRGQSRKALGAYRSTGQENESPRYKQSVVRIIVGEKESYCISPGQRLVLWRPVATEDAFKLSLDAGRIKQEITWPASEKEVEVPETVVNKRPRRIVLPAIKNFGSTRARLWFGEPGDTPGEQLQWFNSRGCNVQFESALTFYQTF